MKKFEKPVMMIQKLDPEGVIGTSSCFEKFACTSCYCQTVQCGGTYECIGLVCEKLSEFD
jgi:hypothetical protein